MDVGQAPCINFAIFPSDAWRSARVLSPSLRREAGEERLVWPGAHPPARARCPLEHPQVGQVETIPDDTADQGKETGEATRPVAQKRLDALQHGEQEGSPDLPAQSVGTVTEGIAELQGLFDLPEADLVLPPTAVGVGDGARSQLEILGEKLPLHLLPVEFAQGDDATQTDGVFPTRLSGDTSSSPTIFPAGRRSRLLTTRSCSLTLLPVTQKTPRMSHPKRSAKST